MDNNDYDLFFINKNDLKDHIFEYFEKYIDSFKKFNFSKINKNVLDPFKLLFDQKVYNKSDKQLIMDEISRQIDKTNNNIIGYFHQNLFKKFQNSEWNVPKEGFDIENKSKKIYVELKNKHNTMNEKTQTTVYLKMLNQLAKDNKSQCYLVQIISKKSQLKEWEITINKQKQRNNNIFICSIDKFYELITNDKYFFYKLTYWITKLLDEIIIENNYNTNPTIFKSTDIVISEILEYLILNKSINLLENIFLKTFETYIGFDSWIHDKNE